MPDYYFSPSSFKSTLDEVREADILVHVVDISHPNFQDHIHTVNETLKDLGAIDKEIITVFNKIDAYTLPEADTETEHKPLTIKEFKKSWMAKNNNPAIFISALNRDNIEEFRKLLYNKIKAIHIQRYPYNELLY